MKQKVSSIIMSTLSDVQELLPMNLDGNPVLQSNRIDFVKFMVMRHKDISEEICAEDEYKAFIEKFPRKKF